MFFKGKSKKEILCPLCSEKINEKYSFCPYCGEILIDQEKEMKKFGMLGRNDAVSEEIMEDNIITENFGITDKIIGSLINSFMKNIDRQFREMGKAQITNHPNGIKISLGVPVSRKKPSKKTANKTITEEQLKRMSSLPRIEAKTNMKRLSDKVVYELSTPGLQSPEDVFVSKLESGYEIKAIGDKNIYVNSLPINLPISGFAIDNGRLFLEFRLIEN